MAWINGVWYPDGMTPPLGGAPNTQLPPPVAAPSPIAAGGSVFDLSVSDPSTGRSTQFVNPAEGGISPEQTMRRIQTERSAQRIETAAVNPSALSDATRISRTPSSIEVSPQGQQQPANTATEPSPQDIAAQRQLNFQSELARSQSRIQEAEARRVSSPAVQMRMKLAGAGVPRAQAAIVGDVAAGAPIDAHNLAALNDLANADVGKYAKNDPHAVAYSAARDLVLKITTDTEQSIKGFQEANQIKSEVRGPEKRPVTVFTGGEFVDKADYAAKVEAYVNGPDSKVPAQVRQMVKEQLLSTALTPESVLKSIEQTREANVARVNEQEDKLQKDKDWFANTLRVEGRSEPQVQTIMAQVGAGAGVWADEMKRRIAEREAGSRAGADRAEQSARIAMNEGKFDPTVPEQAQRAISSGVANKPMIDFLVKTRETKLPTDLTDVAIEPIGMQRDAEKAAIAIQKGVAPDVAIAEGMKSSEAYGSINATTPAAKEGARTRFELAVRDTLDKALRNSISTAAMNQNRADTETVNKAVLSASPATIPNLQNRVTALAERLSGSDPNKGVDDIAPSELKTEAEDFVMGQVAGMLGAGTTLYKDAADAAFRWAQGAPSQDPRFASLNGRLTEIESGLIQAQQNLLGPVAEKNMRQKEMVAENFKRGLLTLFEKDADGNAVTRTFSANDPESVSRYYAYARAGATERAGILAQEKAVNDVRANVAAFAQKQEDYISQGLVVMRRLTRNPLNPTGFEQTYTPAPPTNEESWDDYFSYLREQTAGAPEQYARLYAEATKAKDVWQTTKAKEIAKTYDVSEGDAKKLMDQLANANEEWSVVLEQGAVGEISSAGVRGSDKRNQLRDTGATRDGEGKQVTIATAERRIPDTQFIPRAQMPKSADIPKDLQFADAVAANAAEKAGAIPDKTFVLIGGKFQFYTKD